MREPSHRTRWVLFGVACFISGIVAAKAATPAYRHIVAATYQKAYGDLVFKCDQAMREHFVAKARVAEAADERTAALLVQAEVGLMDCHDYDLLQKHLISIGLTENDFAAMRLKVIDERDSDIRELVRIHEIRY